MTAEDPSDAFEDMYARFDAERDGPVVRSRKTSDDFAGLAELIARGQAEQDRRLARSQDPDVVAATRRSRRRRRIVAASVVGVVIAIVATFIPLALNAPTAAATVQISRSTTIAPGAAVVLAIPGVGESALSVTGSPQFEALTGTKEIVASGGGDGAKPMASISKLITALVVLQAKPVGATDTGPTITFSKADADLYDKYYAMEASIAKMNTGSTMSLRDALTTMLVASACNYAEAVSTWAFGNQANFLAATRKWLAANGLSKTKMVEPTGISPNNVSTPTEMIAIGKLAMANPLIASIVGMSNAFVANIGTVTNTNDLLGVAGINGIKTGTLGGSNLLFSAHVPVAGVTAPLTVVGVVLGGDDRASVDSATTSLISSVESGFHTQELTRRGDVFGTVSTPWEEKATVVAGESASMLTWSNTPITSTIKVGRITAAKSGKKVGTVTYSAGTAKVVVPLVLKGSITGPDDWWKLTHAFGAGQ
jgi:D-alanyl-D-alanine carboxypeptidase (penicillin-binding protein 5/6)